MRNTSLDEFLDADEAADSGGTDEGAESATDAPVDDTEPVEPATSTFDWTPSGAACDDCGDVVERRWRDDVGLVCPDCKTW